MFHSIPTAMRERMAYLEKIDAADRQDGSPLSKRLRQIPPETGKFLAIMVASAPTGECVEIGTSAGYSTMWLALGCRAAGRHITTFEVLPNKIELARETFKRTGLEELVTLVHGDARQRLPDNNQIGFCFLDAEKDVYADCYELAVPKLVKGGLLLADNAISHQADLQPMLNRALSDERMDAVIVPIGSGVLVGRKI